MPTALLLVLQSSEKEIAGCFTLVVIILLYVSLYVFCFLSHGAMG